MNLIIVARNRYGRGAALGEGDNQQLAQVFRNIGVQRLEQDMNHQTLFCGGAVDTARRTANRSGA